MGKLKRLLGLEEQDGANNGCSGHHYGKAKPQDEYRVRELGGRYRTGFEAQQKVVRECKHHGCPHTNSHWEVLSMKVGDGYGNALEQKEFDNREQAWVCVGLHAIRGASTNTRMKVEEAVKEAMNGVVADE